MQAVDYQSHDKQHDLCSLITYGVGDLLVRDPAVPEHGHALWPTSGPAWPIDSFAIDHQTIDHFGYSGEEQQQQQQQQGSFLTGTHKIEYCPATNFQIQSEEWPDLSLDAACDKYRSPVVLTSYTPNSQSNFGFPAETLEPRDEVERDNDCLSPIPTSPDEGPGTQKRHRNRLAAARCRKKAKRGVDELQQRERDLLRENKMLSAEAGLLREEILQLKYEILRHSECDNDCIRQYIQRAAEQVGRAESDNSTCGPPGLPAANSP
ncbi:hypothetical protein O1611_g1899 [Lasiodiplodia mahajangana]|uniref:Uncharacterized protein n=1 Tax=Lasiodiplodia mahajangana TaxID=1108764 RepID=A0ACC2JW97_9PEZI|nr:hypothetical protein O1611_g1899 [Lasiodiplodia mahajangana]